MKEPELVLKARDAISERKGRVILKNQMHNRLAKILRDHGDEVVFGGVDDYVLKVPLNSNGLDFALNSHSEGADIGLPSVRFSFESSTVNKCIILLSDNEEVFVANSKFDIFRKIAKKGGKKQKEGLDKIGFRVASKSDLLQFAELVDFLEERVKYRRGQVDPVGFHNRIGVV